MAFVLMGLKPRSTLKLCVGTILDLMIVTLTAYKLWHSWVSLFLICGCEWASLHL